MYQSPNFMDPQPMSLGSPPPTSHQPPMSPYLPGFLLGDKAHTGSPHASIGKRSIYGAAPPTPQVHSSTPVTPRFDLIGGKTGSENLRVPPPIRRLATEMGSSPGPDNISVLNSSKHVSFSPDVVTGYSVPTTPAPPTSGLSQSMSTAFCDTSRLVPSSPTQLDPFYTQGDDLTSRSSLDDTAVTIFGFPPSSASYILQQFAQYGTILHHSISTDGNWMHVKYQSSFQAKKALSKNGKVFGDKIMIGVRPCIDKSTFLGEDSKLLNTTLNQSGIENLTSRGTPKIIRPLTAACQAARSENEVLPTGQVAHKNGSFVSKAMEYMFGW